MNDELGPAGRLDTVDSLPSDGRGDKSGPSLSNQDHVPTRWVIAGLLVVGLFSAALVVVGLREDWTFSDSLGVASLAISIPGFTIAIIGIRRARTIAVATRQAVDFALKQVESGRLVEAISEMRFLVETIQDSCDDGSPKAFRRSVSRWRYLAGSATALVEKRFGPGHSVIPILQKSMRLARETNLSIYEEGVSLREASADFLGIIEEAADELTSLKESLLSTIEPNVH